MIKLVMYYAIIDILLTDTILYTGKSHQVISEPVSYLPLATVRQVPRVKGVLKAICWCD